MQLITYGFDGFDENRYNYRLGDFFKQDMKVTQGLQQYIILSLNLSY